MMSIHDTFRPRRSGRGVARSVGIGFGKTFHTWQYDRDDFPYGIPQLMMGLTADGQADEALIRERDRRLGVSTPQKRQNRADLPTPAVAAGANSWESGRTVQVRLEEMDFKR